MPSSFSLLLKRLAVSCRFRVFFARFATLLYFIDHFNKFTIRIFTFSPFDDLKDFRYKGHFYGGGVSYGYQFVLGRHWNLGATIGLGYAYVRYKKYECEECGDMLEKSNKNYWGLTKAALNLIYIF